MRKVKITDKKNKNRDFDVTKTHKFIIDDDVKDYPLKESGFLNIINHPNIIKPISMFRKDNELYMKLPYYRNISLSKDKFKTIISILKAIIYLHDNEMVHGDIKPQNILIKENDEGILIDLETCKIYETVYENITTPYYGAKEVYDKKEVTSASDIWALGVTFLDLLDYNIKFKNKTPYYENVLTTINILKKYKKDEKYDKMLINMLNENPFLRWTVRDCYNFLTKEKIEIIHIKIPIYPLLKYDIGRYKLNDISVIVGWIIDVFYDIKIPTHVYPFFIGLFDFFMENFGHYIQKSQYQAYAQVVLLMVTEIFCPYRGYNWNSINSLNPYFENKGGFTDFKIIFYDVIDKLNYNFILKSKEKDLEKMIISESNLKLKDIIKDPKAIKYFDL